MTATPLTIIDNIPLDPLLIAWELITKDGESALQLTSEVIR